MAVPKYTHYILFICLLRADSLFKWHRQRKVHIYSHLSLVLWWPRSHACSSAIQHSAWQLHQWHTRCSPQTQLPGSSSLRGTRSLARRSDSAALVWSKKEWVIVTCTSTSTIGRYMYTAVHTGTETITMPIFVYTDIEKYINCWHFDSFMKTISNYTKNKNHRPLYCWCGYPIQCTDSHYSSGIAALEPQ